MTILQGYKTRVDCDDKYCSMRYYKDGEPLSIGVIRSHYYDGGKINGMIVTISEWNVGELLQDISDKHGIGPNEMVDIMGVIKSHAIQKIKEHLTRGKL
jgi:hypothetical protein